MGVLRKLKGKLGLPGDPGAGALAVGWAFGPTLLWALRALFLLSPPAREPTEEIKSNSLFTVFDHKSSILQRKVDFMSQVTTHTVILNHRVLFITYSPA